MDKNTASCVAIQLMALKLIMHESVGTPDTKNKLDLGPLCDCKLYDKFEKDILGIGPNKPGIR